MNQTDNLTNSALFSSWPSTQWPSYSRGVACVFGMLTNTINIWIFLNPKLKDTSYKYMLVNSITNVIYALTSFISIFLVNCSNCPAAESYEAAIYSIGFFYYLANCLQLFKVTLEVTLSFYTYSILWSIKWFLRISFKFIVLILFIFSMVIYIEIIFSYKITQSIKSNDSITYSAILNSFGNSNTGKTLSISAFFIRIFLAVLVLRIINLLSVIKFRKRYKSRKIGNNNNNLIKFATISSLGILKYLNTIFPW